MAELTPFGQKQIKAAGAQTPAAAYTIVGKPFRFPLIVLS
jgi:hypothetical protein